MRCAGGDAAARYSQRGGPRVRKVDAQLGDVNEAA
jgi:hypothetical protein